MEVPSTPWVPPTSWNVFHYNIRSTPYSMVKGTLYPLGKICGTRYPMGWGTPYSMVGVPYPMGWGISKPHSARKREHALLLTLPKSKNKNTNPLLTYQLKLVMSRTRSHILNESSITCKSHDHESLLFIKLTSKK